MTKEKGHSKTKEMNMRGEKEEVKPEKKDPTKMQSIWIKKSSWKKLLLIKNGLGLTWSQLIDVWLEQIIQSNIVPEETIQGLQEVEKEFGSEITNSTLWKTTFGIGSRWPKAAEILVKIQEESKNLNNNLEELITTVEDHAEIILSIGDNPSENS